MASAKFVILLLASETEAIGALIALSVVFTDRYLASPVCLFKASVSNVASAKFVILLLARETDAVGASIASRVVVFK